ncbi:ribose-phosphate diphosphokinase [Acidimangrovimonas pyrenivorans]|uniref:ribose-phosphate diphosphokinase n=1 Tax=Acidimangrovimonas pyrenivorans TaxID=2030798 RepID=A0ABV7AIW4_9RHOB
MLFFALKGSDGLGAATAAAAGIELAPHEERDFEGGEHKTRPLVSVRGRDVYVLHNLNGTPGYSANDRLLRLLFFLAACRENGARRVTALVPYLAYSRKDRQTKPRDPVTTRYVAQLFEAVGTDMVVTLDVHTVIAFQNAYRRGSLHLDTRRLFAADIAARLPEGPVAVVSPDGGGVKRAELLREALVAQTGRTVDFGFMEKRRSSGVVSGSLFAGDVEGRTVFILDDMIVGGGTMVRAATACRERGAAAVHLLATHGMMTEKAIAALDDPAIAGITVTDSVAPFAVPLDALGDRLRVLSVAPLLGQTIVNLHEGRPMGDLLTL